MMAERMTTTTADNHVAVRIVPNGNAGFIAFAFLLDSANYGGDSYWFTVGHYATFKNAQHASVRQLAKHGYVIEF